MQYFVAVRALCEFTAKAGDLDLRFTPSPTAQQGIAGHQSVAGRRGAGYEAEIALKGEFGPLCVRGRADGFDAARNRLEEIKTHRGDLHRQPANHRSLHWAQAKVYGHLLCTSRELGSLEVALVYFDIASQRETVLAETFDATALRIHFEALCTRFVAWAEQEITHREVRNAALDKLAFPHPEFRPGQHDLAAGVYRASLHGRCLMAQAPTGIGKTAATLFPMLRAWPTRSLDKLFFLAAKTPGRKLALDALERIGAANPGLPLRVLELTARDKACEHPDKACHGESCPLAKGFYDRLPAARSAALDGCGVDSTLERGAVREVARQHQVCPYYLAQELVRWSDVVVADYNYWFDTSALLHALALEYDWRAGVLVDEAHNLVERGRRMYSAELAPAGLRAVRATAPPGLKRTLGKLQRAWAEIAAGQQQVYAVHDVIAPRFLLALQQANAAIADHLADPAAPPQPDVDAALQQLHFDLLAFGALAEAFGEHSLFDVTLASPHRGRKPDAQLCIRNLIPAPFLGPRFAAAQTTTLFSATLAPQDFYRNTLGLPAETAWLDVASPFNAGQLEVRLVRSISTRFGDRQRSVKPIVALMAQAYQRNPGNYLAFFSSFEYLRMVASAFACSHPEITMWEQAPRMAEPERDAFLERFENAGRGIGFAVLGGSFAEGIDLPGDRLIGAFIATLGLPQLNPVNEQMKLRMDAAFGRGYDYTYLFPGIQKVVQAAGRVIRTREDRGTVMLIDDRFSRPAVRALLPAWWGL